MKLYCKHCNKTILRDARYNAFKSNWFKRGYKTYCKKIDRNVWLKRDPMKPKRLTKRWANRIPLKERFLSKVNKSGPKGCWIWTGCLSVGYGLFYNKGQWKAHRVSWELHKGKIPHGLWVLHKCDNPPCVNPDHLFLGTQSENMKDAYLKGRLVPPVNIPRTVCYKGHKFTKDNVYLNKNGTRRCLKCLLARIERLKR